MTGALPDCSLSSVASGFRCKWAGVVSGFVVRLGDGTDSFGAVGGLAGGDGAWLELAGWVEQGAAQVLQEAEAVGAHVDAAPAGWAAPRFPDR